MEEDTFNENNFIPFEKFLNGIYIKYNNNVGTVLPLEKGSITYDQIYNSSVFLITLLFFQGEN